MKRLWKLSILICCFWLAACSSADDLSNEKAFNVSWTPAYDNLTAYWSMSGGLYSDGSALPSGVGNSGIIKNPNGTGLKGVSGPVGFALQFDGVDDRVAVAYKNSMNWQYFSLSLWVKSSTSTGLRSLLTSRDNSTAALGYSLQLNNANQPQIILGQGSSVDNWTTVVGQTISAGVWVHVAVIYDGRLASIYQNGVLTGSLVTGFHPNISRPVYIGAGKTELTPAAGEFFNGAIDEVGIWKSSLTAADVLTIYNKQVL